MQSYIIFFGFIVFYCNYILYWVERWVERIVNQWGFYLKCGLIFMYGSVDD
jgi:hypothetical protein